MENRFSQFTELELAALYDALLTAEADGRHTLAQREENMATLLGEILEASGKEHKELYALSPYSEDNGWEAR